MNKNFKMLSGKDYNYLTEEQINNRLRTNMMVLYALSEAGDNPAVKREVIHFIMFNNKKDKQSFINEVSKMGYSDIQTDQLDVDICTILSMDSSDIHTVSLTLNNLAVKHNGVYDGWETMVCNQERKVDNMLFDDFSGCEVIETPFEYHGTKYVDVCVRFDGQEIHYEYRLCDNEYEEDYNEQD